MTALLFHDVGKGTPDEGHVTASVPHRGTGPSPVRYQRPRVGFRGSFSLARILKCPPRMNGRDISDPSTVRDVASKTGTVERLRLLTLLTYGDISAVNPAAMTPWRRQLLWNLYTQTYAELTRELTARTSLPGYSGWTRN